MPVGDIISDLIGDILSALISKLLSMLIGVYLWALVGAAWQAFVVILVTAAILCYHARMLESCFFYDELIKHGTRFFTGVPDSLLKNFCAYITDNAPNALNIIAANEGCAVGLCVGHYLAAGEVPLVYMQNSGLGNTVNPILSLADSDVYSVPLVMLIGWRGMPGIHDEPQHIKQGKVTLALLDAMRIPYVILSDSESEAAAQLDFCYKTIRQTSAPFAIVVRKGTFAPYALKNNRETDADLTREEAIGRILEASPLGAAFVSTTGMISRELFEMREKRGEGHGHDFLTVGGMGHASQIALGIALSCPHRPVVCLDGDGAALMHTGGLTTIGTRRPRNLTHIVLNNGAHDSVGGQPTVALQVDLCKIALAAQYRSAVKAVTEKELDDALFAAMLDERLLSALPESGGAGGPSFIEVRVKKGSRSDLGRPTTTPQENKKALMKFLAS